MPCILTTIHEPVALSETCRRLHLSAPRQSGARLDAGPVFGWVVRLRGLRHEIVFDTHTGLVAYHPDDNAFHRYGRIMSFVYRCYEVQARLRRDPKNFRVA